MSNLIFIGIIMIICIICVLMAIACVEIESKIDKEGIVHFKIDLFKSIIPLMVVIFLIWLIAVIYPVRYYRTVILSEIQMAKECIDERYEYCPHCGEKLEYDKHFPWSDEQIQNAINRYNNEDYSLLKWLCEDKSENGGIEIQ